MAENYYGDDDQSYYGGQPGGLSAIGLIGQQYTTKEAQDFAREYLNKLKSKTSDQEIDTYMKRIKAQNEAARVALQAARERLLNQRQDKSQLWFALAQGFGAPTKFGTFGEAMGNVGEAMGPAVGKYDVELNTRRREQDAIELALANVDDPELAAQLEILKLRQDAANRMGVKALDVLGRPLQGAAAAQAKTIPMAAQALDRAFINEVYVPWMSGGSSDAQKSLDDLNMAEEALRGPVDPTTGQRVPPKNLTGKAIGTIFGLPKGFGNWAGGMLFPDAKQIKQLVEYTVQQSLRPTLGAQFTENEGERLISRVYDPQLDESVNAERVKQFRLALARASENKTLAAKHFEKYGTLSAIPGVTDGFKARYNWNSAKATDFLPVGSLPGDVGYNPKRSWWIDEPGKDVFEGQKEIPYEELMEAGGDPTKMPEPVQRARGGKIKRRRYADGGIVGENVLRGARPFTTAEWEAAMLAPLPGEGEEDSEVDPENGMPLVSMATMAKLRELMQKYGSQLTEEEVARGMSKSLSDPMGMQEGGEVEQEDGWVADGRVHWKMPDNRWVSAPVGIPKEIVFQRYIRGTPNYQGPRTLAPQPAPAPAPAPADEQQPAGPVSTGRGPDPMDVDTYFDMATQGGAGALAGNLGARGLHRAADLYPGHKITGGEGRVLDALETEGVTPREWTRRTRVQSAPMAGRTIGLPVTVGDVGGPSIQGLAKEAFGSNRPTREYYDEMTKRQAGAGPRVREQINRSLKPDEFIAEEQRLVKDPKALNALQVGRKNFSKMKLDRFEQYVNSLSFAEKDALRTGVAYHMYDILGKTGPGSNPAAKLINQPDQLAKLKLILRPKEFEIFQEALNLESNLWEQSADQLRSGKRALEGVKDPLTGTVRGTVRTDVPFRWWSPSAWAIRWARKKDQIKPQEAEEILKMLRTGDLAGMQSIERNLTPKYGRRGSRKKRVFGATVLGGIAGASHPLWPEIEKRIEESDEVIPFERPYAKGGLVTKPDWMKEAEQSLNLIQFGGDDMISSLIR